MKITYIKKDKRLIFEIEEDIDECCVQKIRRRIDNEIQRYMPKEVIFVLAMFLLWIVQELG